MLALDRVSYAYPAGPAVLQEITLDLRPGDRLMLTGISGCGKSTLLRMIAGLIAPSSGALHTPSGQLPRIGFVRQQPENQLIAGTVAEEIAFALEYQGLASQEIGERVEEALERSALTELRDRAPSHLSGGQMQRVAFAAAWAMRPELWLLDEPSAYLDPDGEDRLNALLEGLPPESALLRIASSPGEYALTGELAVMHEGRILARGEPTELFAKRVLEAAGLQPPRSWRLTQMSAEESLAPRDSDLREYGSAETATVHSESATISHRVRVEKVQARRRAFLGPELEVLRGIDLELRGGEPTALVGATGAGKSTLIEVLAGLIEPSAGSVAWDDQPPEMLHGRIGVAFQFPERGFFAETVLDEVAYGALNLGLKRREAREHAAEALAALGLHDRGGLFARSPFELSGGEARRVALASVYVLRPVGWLLDEPTAGLDDANADAVGRMIRAEAARGCPVLVAGHDLDRLADWCPRWLLLSEGRIERDSDPREWWMKGENPWPPPATVQAWRSLGRPVAEMPGVGWERAVGGFGR